MLGPPLKSSSSGLRLRARDDGWGWWCVARQVPETTAFGTCGLAQPGYTLPPPTFAGEWACSPGQV